MITEVLALSWPVRAEWFALARALDELADRGRRTPCQVDAAPFHADDVAERREAATACRACPALFACAAFALANDERYGVWAGVDLMRPGGRAARLAQLAALVEPDEPARPRGAGSRRSPAEGRKTAAVRLPTPDPNVVTVTASRHSKQKESR